jgi:Xaa-Pro aminopeptidase
MDNSREFEHKLRRMLALLDEHDLDGLLLQRVSSFAWATCGVRADVNLASTTGVARLLVTRKGRYLITTNLESSRYEQDARISEQGWELCVSPWYTDQDLLSHLANGLRLGADSLYPGALDLTGQVAQLRSTLTVREMERMRSLGQLCTEIVESAAHEARPGMREEELAARIACRAAQMQVQPITDIVASDERITAFRHPLPSSKRIDRLVMLVLCGRKDGLVCSITRFVHFGPIPAQLAGDNFKAARIAAVGLHFTRPQAYWDDVFSRIQQAYAQAGHPDEWVVHHLGGPAGYEPREAFARPGLHWPVETGQAGVWNPSLGAARSVDTFLVGEQCNELVTISPEWPRQVVEVEGANYPRPDILVFE